MIIYVNVCILIKGSRRILISKFREVSSTQTKIVKVKSNAAITTRTAHALGRLKYQQEDIC